MSTMFKTAIWATTLITAAAFASQASALKMTLTSSDGATIVIEDEVINGLQTDQALGTPGIVSFTGAVGSNFTFTASFGTSKPILQGDVFDGAALHLSSLVITSAGAGGLTITLEDDGFVGGGATNFLFGIGGVSGGLVDAAAYYDASSTPDVIGGTMIAQLGPVGGSPFADQGVLFESTSAEYGLAIVAHVAHTLAGQITSFDAEIRVPEPAALGLFGLGLIGLGIAARRRKAH